MVPVPNRMAQAFRFRTRRLDGEFSFDVIGMIESLFEVAQNGARMMSVSGVVDSVLQRITLTYGRGHAFRSKTACSRERVPFTTISKLF